MAESNEADRAVRVYQGAPLRECNELAKLCEKVEAVANMLNAFSDPEGTVSEEQWQWIVAGCQQGLESALADVKWHLDVEHDIYKLMPSPYREDVRRALYPFMCCDYRPSADPSDEVQPKKDQPQAALQAA